MNCIAFNCLELMIAGQANFGNAKLIHCLEFSSGGFAIAIGIAPGQ